MTYYPFNNLFNATGDTSQMKSKLEDLEGKLRTTEQQHQMAQQTLQETLSKCSSLEQSLESKKDCVRDQQVKIERLEEDLETRRSEVNRLQENQVRHSEMFGPTTDIHGRSQTLYTPRVMASSVMGLKLGVLGYLPTTHAKTNASTIFACRAVFRHVFIFTLRPQQVLVTYAPDEPRLF